MTDDLKFYVGESNIYMENEYTGSLADRCVDRECIWMDVCTSGPIDEWMDAQSDQRMSGWMCAQPDQ